MIELKTFKEQAQKLRIAQRRRDDLLMHPINSASPDKTLHDAKQICAQMESEFDATLAELDKQLRIAPEQINADKNLSNALEASLKGWETELEEIQKEIIDQAISDSKAEGKSQRLTMLEAREKELKTSIEQAERKLGRVSQRVASPTFSNTVNQIVDNIKP